MHGGYHRLFNRNRVGFRKGIPKSLVERLFVPLALALAANRIVPANSCATHKADVRFVPKADIHSRSVAPTLPIGLRSFWQTEAIVRSAWLHGP